VPKLLFVVTEDWYFVSHRLPLAIAARENGYDVSIATRVTKHAATIENAGIRVIPFSLSRRVGNPFAELLALIRLYRQEKPDLVHHVALKPVLYGVTAARIAGVPAWINAIAGLGWMSAAKHGVAGLMRRMFRRTLTHTLNRGRSLTIVQNSDDAAMLQASGVAPERLILIRGAGVDLEKFAPPAEPAQGTPVVVLASRMLWDKGPGLFVEAAGQVNANEIKARFVLIGDTDPGNPNSIPKETLRSWHGKNGVEWLGHCDDVASWYQRAHVACLPSYYGEGIPKSLLEALACGLPVITTDMPGCREVVQNEVNGLLVPPHDVGSLTKALQRLVSDASVRGAMGRQGRLLAEREFASSMVIDMTLSTYRRLRS
jgi:glycosyltransferase involved in cell wall biosynthesis